MLCVQGIHEGSIFRAHAQLTKQTNGSLWRVAHPTPDKKQQSGSPFPIHRGRKSVRGRGESGWLPLFLVLRKGLLTNGRKKGSRPKAALVYEFVERDWRRDRLGVNWLALEMHSKMPQASLFLPLSVQSLWEVKEIRHQKRENTFTSSKIKKCKHTKEGRR
jgi:hypothetical protein